MSSTRTAAALATSFALLAGCGDTGPTAVDPLRPGGPSLAQSPGQLTAGQIPGTISRTGQYSGMICGIAVDVVFHEAGTEWESSFGPPVRETGTFVSSWTNPANGRSVQLRHSGQVTREVLEVYDDGSFRARETFRHGVKLSGEAGAPLTFATGRIALEFVVVPQPGGHVILTDVEVVFLAGPHPDDALFESPGFCELVEAALL